MNENIRRVLSRYLEDTNPDGLSDSGESWMEYLRDKGEGIGKKHNTAIDMLEHADSLCDAFPTTNPYDYKDPSSKPKDQQDSPPFVNEVFPEADYGLFMTPKLFKERGVLEDWNEFSEQDPTQDEDQQLPAMSLTRKLAQEVVAGHLLERMPLWTSDADLRNIFFSKRIAATLTEIVSKDEHYKHAEKAQRTGACQATWANKSQTNQVDKGLFRFRVSCGGHPAHTVFFQFLRDEVAGTRLTYADYPVLTACTCPSFLWWGAQYYALKDGYMYQPMFRPSYRAPVQQNQISERGAGRGLNFRVCKHIWAAYFAIKQMRIDKPFKRFPLFGAPSKIMNTEQWKALMKFDYTEANFKQRLKADNISIPAYFNQEDITPAVVSWVKDIWMPRSDIEKIKALGTMVEFPERIFYVLMKEAFLKQSQGQKISDALINEGYKLMSKLVQPEADEPPEQAKEIKPDEVPPPGTGTGAFPKTPDGVPADKFLKETPEETEEREKEELVKKTTLNVMTKPGENKKVVMPVQSPSRVESPIQNVSKPSVVKSIGKPMKSPANKSRFAEEE